ncbi:MAG: DUF4340 domain-containing protein [bacterium]|nr:DUF4340 domain-containing protein [bacterium]
MKPIKLKHYLLVFILLLLLAFFFVFKITSSKIFGPQNTYANPLYRQSINQIDFQFAPSDSKTNYSLTFNQDKWWYKQDEKILPADYSLVEKIITSLTSLSTLPIISTNPQFLDRFKLDKKTKTTLIWHTPQSAVSLYVGKMAPDFQSTYVMFEADGPVLLLEGVDRFVLVPSDPILYSPLSSLSYTINDLASLQATDSAKKKEISLAKNNGQWYLQGQKISQVKLERWLDNLKNLRGDAVKSINQVQLNSRPLLSIKAAFNQKTVNLSVYSEKNNQNLWLATDYLPGYLWQISPGIKDRLVLKAEELTVSSTPAPLDH